MKLRKKIVNYLDSSGQFLSLTAFAAGLFPLVHYYNSNFLMVNSWPQFIWFLAIFIVAPVLTFNLVLFCANYFSVFRSLKFQILSGLNFFTFGLLLVFVTIGFTNKMLLGIALISAILAFLIKKHLKKIVLLQLLLSAMGLILFVPNFIGYLNQSDSWMELPDAIDEVVFKARPNIYVIQPDGYVNFSEINKYPYNYDNSSFKTFLETSNFKIYNKNRSNYFSTLTSNASMFAMKHHYYMNAINPEKSTYDYRKSLAGNNNVVKTLNQNGYKTFMLLDYPYIIINRPKKELDFINYDYKTMSYIGNKWKGKEPQDTLEYLIKANVKTPNFFFIEKILPTHIENLKAESKGIKGERIAYLERLEQSNQWLKHTIETIIKQDANGIIILVSDHGGYVGLESAEDIYTKIEDGDLKTSIFSSLLAIKWSGNEAINIDSEIKSNVNLFRVLFSHLSKNQSYLKNLEADKSYITINNGDNKGVFEYLDESGLSVFDLK
jgi:hypothetical protein